MCVYPVILDWIASLFLPKCRGDLKRSSEYVVERLERMGLQCVKPQAGVFVMVKMSQVDLSIFSSHISLRTLVYPNYITPVANHFLKALFF